MSARKLPGRAGQMMEAPGDTLIVQTARTPQVLARDGADRTISNEALNELMGATGQWVMSRIMRKHADSGKLAQAVELEVTVRLDGADSDEGSIPLRIVVPIDGSRRLGGAQ